MVEVVWFGLYLSGFIHKQGTWYINICTRLNLSQTRSLHSSKRERPVVGMGVAKPARAWCLLWFINQSLAPILTLCLEFVNLRVSSGIVRFPGRLLKLGWEPFYLRNCNMQHTNVKFWKAIDSFNEASCRIVHNSYNKACLWEPKYSTCTVST